MSVYSCEMAEAFFRIIEVTVAVVHKRCTQAGELPGSFRGDVLRVQDKLQGARASTDDDVLGARLERLIRMCKELLTLDSPEAKKGKTPNRVGQGSLCGGEDKGEAPK